VPPPLSEWDAEVIADARARKVAIDADYAQSARAHVLALARLVYDTRDRLSEVAAPEVAGYLGMDDSVVRRYLYVLRRADELQAAHELQASRGISPGAYAEPHFSYDALHQLDRERTGGSKSDRPAIALNVRNPHDRFVCLPNGGRLCVADWAAFLPGLAEGSIDLVIIDPPHGCDRTSLAWDQAPAIAPLMGECWRVVKPTGTVIVHGTQPFSSEVVCDQVEHFRNQWIWPRPNAASFFTARYQPSLLCEEVIVFNRAPHQMVFNPQRTPIDKPYRRSHKTPHGRIVREYNGKHPTDLLNFGFDAKVDGARRERHQTQKPVRLIRNLIRTYSDASDVVLDCFAGYGSSAIAAALEGRRFVGCELLVEHFEIARSRLTALGLAGSPP
jgi:DNA modification methylase